MRKKNHVLDVPLLCHFFFERPLLCYFSDNLQFAQPAKSDVFFQLQVGPKSCYTVKPGVHHLLEAISTFPPPQWRRF